MTDIPARLCKIPGCLEFEVDQKGRYAKLCQAHAAERREQDAAVVPLTEEQQQEFLLYVGAHPECSVREAAKVVGVHRRAVRALRKTDVDFDADYHEARGLTPEKILAEIYRRAVDGVEEPVYGTLPGAKAGTGKVGSITRYSDRLLMGLGKAFVPELRERLEVTGRDGRGLEVTVEHDFGSLIAGLQDAGVLPGGDASALDAAPLELLPARTD